MWRIFYTLMEDWTLPFLTLPFCLSKPKRRTYSGKASTEKVLWTYSPCQNGELRLDICDTLNDPVHFPCLGFRLFCCGLFLGCLVFWLGWAKIGRLLLSPGCLNRAYLQTHATPYTLIFLDKWIFKSFFIFYHFNGRFRTYCIASSAATAILLSFI